MRVRRRVVGGLFGMTLLMSTAAFADDPTKQQCADADTNAQSLRATSKLTAAREALRVCVSASCPQVIQKDCTERLDELDRIQPTLVIAAQDESGNDLSAVKVTADGKPFADSLDGPAIPIDPGAHDLQFESAGKQPVSRHIIVREGDKGRREQVLFKAAVAGAVAATPAPATTTPPPTTTTAEPPPEADHGSNGSTQRILGIAVAGVGVVGVAVGAIFGVSASSSWSNSKNECNATTCADHAKAVSDHDSAVSSGTISTIGFIAGGVFVAGGAVLYFTAPKASSSPTVGIAPTLGGAVIKGTF